MTRARACVVPRSNVLECVSTMTRMFCSKHAGLLDGRCLRGRVGKGVGHLDHVRSYGVREVVSSIPDRGNIVG